MQRRTLLQSLGALPLLTGGYAALLAPVRAATSVTGRRPARVRPSDPAWPSAEHWEQLRSAVGGNLMPVSAPFASCESAPSGTACLEAVKNIRNPYWVGDQPAGTQVSGWLDAWTPAPSVFAVKARNAADVAAAVTFARTNNLRLVVKGGGHSYLGTSNAPDSLLIWTRAMSKVTLHRSFVGQGCKGHVAPVPAVSSEAGAVWMDLYNAVTTGAGRYVQGGGCTSVGVAGLVQSGGFGSFSKGFGTAASGLLEAEIVTADGQVRIANACSNPDLFWAIKGGGGGTFGVLTRLTLRTHELPAFLGFAGGTIKAQSDAAFSKLIAHTIGFYDEHLFNPHWGEQLRFAPDNTLEVSMVSQGLDKEQAAKVWQPYIDWVKASPKDFTFTSPLHSGAWEARSWWDLKENPAMIHDTREGAPTGHGWWRGDQDQVGAYLHGYESLWLPASLLHKDRQKRLADALFEASRYKKVELHINKGLAGAPREALAASQQTATNPAVLDAFALAIIADGEGPAYPGLEHLVIDRVAAHADARDIDRAAAALRAVAPNSGCYVSESNYFNRSWQQEYWGSNYPRLRSIKAQYDPTGLFFVHHGVGSEDWSADGFSPAADNRG
jgi:FAD/FMN-containing dehydrogenase